MAGKYLCVRENRDEVHNVEGADAIHMIDQIRKLKRAIPFQPFEIVLSSGTILRGGLPGIFRYDPYRFSLNLPARSRPQVWAE
jgi:hypothetical protein